MRFSPGLFYFDYNQPEQETALKIYAPRFIDNVALAYVQ
jgi:hypothetical protein